MKTDELRAGVVVVGLGNIGSHAAQFLAREPGIERLTIIDPDQYEAKNLLTQNTVPADLGRPKAVAQADRLRAINPPLSVVAIVDRAEHVPLGVFRAAVVLSCVDSRASRVYLNSACARLGTLWIDAGVHADNRLARVNVYAPAPDNPCLECAFDDRDYEMLEQEYPCNDLAVAPRPTNAPASLGALAAALQVLECEKLLRGRTQQLAVGRQVLIDAASHKHYVTCFRRNPACRFDHEPWNIDLLDVRVDTLRIVDALRYGTELAPDPAHLELHVAGQTFVRKLTCAACGAVRHLPWRLAGRLGLDALCPGCGQRMLAAGFDTREWLRERDLAPAALSQPLSAVGGRAGDVVVLRGPAGERHLQLDVPDACRDVSSTAVDDAHTSQRHTRGS